MGFMETHSFSKMGFSINVGRTSTWKSKQPNFPQASPGTRLVISQPPNPFSGPLQRRIAHMVWITWSPSPSRGVEAGKRHFRPWHRWAVVTCSRSSSWEAWTPAATGQGVCRAGAVTVAAFPIVNGQLCSFQALVCSCAKKQGSACPRLPVGQSRRQSGERQQTEAQNKSQRPLHLQLSWTWKSVLHGLSIVLTFGRVVRGGLNLCLPSVQFSRSVVSDSLQPHESQHTRPPCPPPTPGVHSDSRPSSPWCHPAISSSVVPFSSHLQSFPASGSFQRTQLFASGSQCTGASASASVLPMNTQDWSPLGWTGWISLQSKGLSRVFSSTTVQKHQFFSAQLSLRSNYNIRA